MPRRNSHPWTTLCWAALGAVCVIYTSEPVWAASRSIEINFNSLSTGKGDGEIRGTETYGLSEHDSLVALKAAGDTALEGCLLDAWETRKVLTSLGLTVREINVVLANNRYELNWRADFSGLPSNITGVAGMTLQPSKDKPEEYRFAGTLAIPPSSPMARGVSPLGEFSFTLSVHFPGTVNRDIIGPGEVDHSGEAVSWKTDLRALRTKPVPVSATVIAGRASEQRYWLILMATLTVLVAVIMLGLLRRGGAAPKPASAATRK